MKYSIVGKDKLPNKLKGLAINGKKVLCMFDEFDTVKKVVPGSVRELNSKVESANGNLSSAPSGLDFSNIDLGSVNVKSSVKVGSKAEVVNSIKSLLGGNASGVMNFKFDDFWHHVQAAAARTIKKNKNAAVQASRLRIGQIALNGIVDHLFKSVQGTMPGIKIPFIGEKKLIDLEKYREIISIVIGNASLLGFDIFSYFKIPMTGLAEVTANCMLEYAYDLGSQKVAKWLPQTKIISGIGNIFKTTEDEVGVSNLKDVMTEEEKVKFGNSTQEEIAKQIAAEKEQQSIQDAKDELDK